MHGTGGGFHFQRLHNGIPVFTNCTVLTMGPFGVTTCDFRA